MQPAGLRLLHGHDRGERLADRADLEAGLRPDRPARRRVGEAADDDAEELVAVGQRERGSRRVGERQAQLQHRADPLERAGEARHG